MGDTHLLLINQPFATKLPNTSSACVFVMFVFKWATSRKAAREDKQKDSFGASIICSSYMRRDAVRLIYE